ncbi:MAG: ATP synthase F1 subunit epsilon [Oscillospiraceae bacterium]|nr:ATP synthase F1 subunit epsilon [Oscillospiraceae bacterium]
MTGFPLKIVTPDGLQYEGQAEELIVRTIAGDIGVMAGHTNCVTPLGMGMATVVIDGEKKYAACIGGMLSVLKGNVTLIPTTFEWADEINAERAADSERRAKEIIDSKNASDTELKLAEARLKRSLIRQSVAQYRNVR